MTQICIVCNKRKVKGVKGITCYKCFSQMVKSGTWQEFMYKQIMEIA